MDTLTLFSKNLNQRSLTTRWPLTPCLLRSHVWPYRRIIVSKSHDNTSMYVDTVINFAKYHIHTHTYILHTTYYVQSEWSHSLLLNSVQARQKRITCICIGNSLINQFCRKIQEILFTCDDRIFLNRKSGLLDSKSKLSPKLCRFQICKK